MHSAQTGEDWVTRKAQKLNKTATAAENATICPREYPIVFTAAGEVFSDPVFEFLGDARA